MWIRVTKKVGTPIIRLISNFADDLGESLVEANKIFLSDKDKKRNVKSLKIAILGLPNAGKSTLINHLIGKPVCAASSKVHTTCTNFSATVHVENIQLVFVDTPGLVELKELKKYKLKNNFFSDALLSTKDADIIGIVQDVSYSMKKGLIDKKITEILELKKQNTISILILNKIDKLKNKKVLLETVKKFSRQSNWPNFHDIFMVSALSGDGVDDLRNYFFDTAKHKNGSHDQMDLSNQLTTSLVQQTIRARLLDDLPQEIPYMLNVNVELIHFYEDNSMFVATIVNCPSLRIARIVIGKAGDRIKKIAEKSEQDLCAIFQTNVRLKISIPVEE